MRSRTVFLCWVAVSGILYFFENQTQTRIMLLLGLLLYLAPQLWKQRPVHRKGPAERDMRVLQGRQKTGDMEDRGDVRDYVPGDPLNRIHWKLSAKHDTLMVRELMPEISSGETARSGIRPDGDGAQRISRSAVRLLFLFLVLLGLMLLFPALRAGIQAGMNRIFEASERVNRYRYDFFPAADVHWLPAAAVWGMISAADLLCLVFFLKSRVLALLFMTGLAGAQVYFGLLLPDMVNLVLFTVFFLFLYHPGHLRDLVLPSILMLAAVLTVLLLFPGADAQLEAVSERVRDEVSRAVSLLDGTAEELPEEETETRHVHTRSLIQGEQDGIQDREYVLVTVEEEEISMPSFVNYLKIALLLLATSVMVILPFLPFLYLNRCRKKAVERHDGFRSNPPGEAVCEMFQDAARWLEVMGYGAGNIPYSEWPLALRDRLPGDYLDWFGRSAEIFEEAAYSEHEIGEAQREEMLQFLETTEQRMKAEAGWKQRLILRYGDCLWI